MTSFKTLARAALITVLGLFPAACAQQGGQSGMQGMSGGAQGSMQGHSMQGGMDMQAMMSQCEDMRRQMAQGTHPNTPGMTQMMAHCNEIDRGMGSGMQGMGSSSPAAAPAATRSR